jgi:carboxylesterase type B
MVDRSLLALSVISLLNLASCLALPTVKVANGTVVGVDDAATGVQKFLGVPFAEPPIGDLRLRQATPLTKGFGTLQANTFGASCYPGRGQEGFSEDCLTLNIWRPANETAGNATLPVLVWLYGGGLTAGSTVSCDLSQFVPLF